MAQFGPMMGYGGYGPGTMGMFGGGAFNRPVYPGWGGAVLDHRQVTAYLQQGDENGQADPKANSVTYTGKDVVIDLVAVQPGHKDQTFEVHGLVDPTLVVPLGATVHLNLVNMDYGDNMEHAVIITPAPPPYPFMPMMATGPGLPGSCRSFPGAASRMCSKRNMLRSVRHSLRGSAALTGTYAPRLGMPSKACMAGLSWNERFDLSEAGSEFPSPKRARRVRGPDQSRASRRRSAFPITETELKLMAAAATTGLNSSPNAG
jgi:hypothetical protein